MRRLFTYLGVDRAYLLLVFGAVLLKACALSVKLREDPLALSKLFSVLALLCLKRCKLLAVCKHLFVLRSDIALKLLNVLLARGDKKIFGLYILLQLVDLNIKLGKLL